jgi:hypothetical protein
LSQRPLNVIHLSEDCPSNHATGQLDSNVYGAFCAETKKAKHNCILPSLQHTIVDKLAMQQIRVQSFPRTMVISCQGCVV